MNKLRTVFFVSDGTGITAEALGHSLISQFEGIALREVREPFIDTPEKAQRCLERIEEARRRDARRPIVVSTLVQADVAAIIHRADAVVLNFFESFIAPLEEELQQKAAHTIGRSRGMARDYFARIEAIDFTVAHDDGVSHRGLAMADIILVGVSRSGKTPTSLYLAMQFGVKAANYPLIPEDFERGKLPDILAQHRRKLFGLTISPERLMRIRQERRPDSRYAALDNCGWEVEQALKLMRQEAIPYLDTTTKSIEEIAATLVQMRGTQYGP